MVQAQVVTERGNVVIYEAKLSGVRAQISEGSQRIVPLHAEKLELEESVGQLKELEKSLEESFKIRSEDFSNDKVAHERELHNLKSRSREVATKIQEDEERWAHSRDDLAFRETKLNKREETLERRELKVNRDERNLARNNELLSL